jgi:tRNA(fMet)-specific endonuclease VapC
MNRYLLDTNMAIAILTGDKEVGSWLKHVSIEQVPPLLFSTVTVCSGGNESTEIKRFLFDSNYCLDVTLPIAIKAGQIRKEQKTKWGRKLKTPDALIIATACENGLTLVSRDQDMAFVEKELNCSLICLPFGVK